MARRSHSAAFAKHAFIRSLVSVLMRTERIFVAVVPLFLVLIRCVQSGTDDLKSCCVPDMCPHTRTIIDHLLPRAKGLAADGEERVRLQEARVVGLERKGQIAQCFHAVHPRHLDIENGKIGRRGLKTVERRSTVGIGCDPVAFGLERD